MASGKILIIDDDRDIRMGMGARMRAAGYETTFAEDGIGAITVALRESPDLVLLDIGLPGGDGYVVLERFARNTRLASIPIFVLSARSAEENEKRSLEAGAVAFFQKPADNESLLAAIARTIG